MSNYPDDIRQFDNDPRSPFYEHPICEVCHEEEPDCVCCKHCKLVDCDCDEDSCVGDNDDS